MNQEFKDNTLTLCSIYHTEMTKSILELNWDHTKKLNHDTEFKWFACDNSPKSAPIKIDGEKFAVVPGVTVPDYVPKGSASGFYMGLALNEMIRKVDTRYMAILDYDVFISRPNWINDVIDHMQKNNISIMGIPFHPKYWAKTRYFPSSHCIIVDRSKFSSAEMAEWDCAPQYSKFELEETQSASKFKKEHVDIEKKKKRNYFLRFFRDNIKKRRYIGLGKDVCYDFYRRYYGKVKHECFQPVAEKRDFVKHYFLSSKWYDFAAFVERILPIPDKYSFIPRRKNYFTYTRFRDLGYFDVLSLGLEEYMWKDTPFAFHMRGYHSIRTNFDPNEQIQLMREVAGHFPQKTSTAKTGL